MATAEQTGFQISAVTERDDLLLAGAETPIRVAGPINQAAERAAAVAKQVLGVDEQWAIDNFTGQLEAMDLREIPENQTPIVSVLVGAEDVEGQIITPSHIVNGHDQLTSYRDGAEIPNTDIWPDMYAKRPTAWWNKTRPDGESELIEAPLRIVLADLALRGTNKQWAKQQAELKKMTKNYKLDATTLEGMTPLDWMMLDADAIVAGVDRPDTQTATRFVQHEMDRVGAGDSSGPGARVSGREAYLDWTIGHAASFFGFRAVMGQKKQAD